MIIIPIIKGIPVQGLNRLILHLFTYETELQFLDRPMCVLSKYYY